MIEFFTSSAIRAKLPPQDFPSEDVICFYLLLDAYLVESPKTCQFQLKLTLAVSNVRIG